MRRTLPVDHRWSWVTRLGSSNSGLRDWTPTPDKSSTSLSSSVRPMRGNGWEAEKNRPSFMGIANTVFRRDSTLGTQRMGAL